MTPESFEFHPAQHFTVGAIGEPGKREFFLQAGGFHNHITVKIEKQHAAGLAELLRRFLQDRPEPNYPLEPLPLAQPVEPLWAVGELSAGTIDRDRYLIMVEEFNAIDPDDDDDAEHPYAPAVLSAHISPDLAARVLVTIERLLEQSRPPCRICGGPIDPSGHLCPRLN